MKKILYVTMFFLTLTMMFANAEKAEAKCYKSGAFSYQYKIEKGSVWITKIEIISNKGVTTLKIPSHINGKEVTAIGSSKEDFKDGDEHKMNIFGVFVNPDAKSYELIPSEVHKKVAKIKKIILPSTLKKISKNCFINVQDGKKINIPKKVTWNVITQFTCVKWKKLKISPKNPKYVTKNGCLLSKNGKNVYGIVQKKKKIYIPNSVKIIDAGILKDGTSDGDYNGADTIVIPKSVNQIGFSVLDTKKPVIIKIDKNNKRYAVKEGSVYSRKTGRLVAGYIKNGVLSIPNTVSKITDATSYLGGQNIKKVIVPSSVKKMAGIFLRPNKITFVFKGKKPPKLTNRELIAFNIPTIVYVPAKYRKVYEDWLDTSLEEYQRRDTKICSR